ncbi:hypothetical protein HUO13_00520 [Saccharopolyspora erythraea]|uniref:hypothetical protein n=1 Tax=Saccharopolyspora erythraea TaxID=1836 RepID=UPI001BA9E299|nr:hypothetical protein [Saccharopolyspora erythraea]QUG99486.1 hypothetical protein HUO13_00520 [Saccharopolyspora erythraea]
MRAYQRGRRRSAGMVAGLAFAAMSLLVGVATASAAPAVPVVTQADVEVAPAEEGVRTYYPWGDYATQAECVAAGNGHMRDMPWEFNGYFCQKQGYIWKLYMDEKD